MQGTTWRASVWVPGQTRPRISTNLRAAQVVSVVVTAGGFLGSRLSRGTSRAALHQPICTTTGLARAISADITLIALKGRPSFPAYQIFGAVSTIHAQSAAVLWLVPSCPTVFFFRWSSGMMQPDISKSAASSPTTSEHRANLYIISTLGDHGTLSRPAEYVPLAWSGSGINFLMAQATNLQSCVGHRVGSH